MFKAPELKDCYGAAKSTAGASSLDGLSVFKSVVSIDDTFPSATAVTDGAKNGMLGR